ncbi:unnamed protein product [Ixodes pacificus]
MKHTVCHFCQSTQKYNIKNKNVAFNTGQCVYTIYLAYYMKKKKKKNLISMSNPLASNYFNMTFNW